MPESPIPTPAEVPGIVQDADAIGRPGAKREISVPFAFVVFATFAYLILLLVEYLAGRWAVLGPILNGTLLLAAIGLVAAVRDLSRPDNPERPDPSTGFALLSILAIVTVISYAQLCRYLQLLIGGFTARRDSYWYWVAFGLDEFLNGVLLDAPRVYGWQVSDVRAVSLWARSLHFLFHLGITTVVIVTVWKYAALARQRLRKPSLTVAPVQALVLRNIAGISIIWCLTVGIAGVGYVHEAVPRVSAADAALQFFLFTSGGVLVAVSVGMWVAYKNLYLALGLLPPYGDVSGLWQAFWRLTWHTLLAATGVMIGMRGILGSLRWVARVVREATM